MRSKNLIRLDVETRAFHAEASAPWLDLVAPGRHVGRYEYVEQLVATYGFDAPLEAALAYTPHLDGFIDVAPRFRSGLLAQDLLALGLGPSGLAGLRQCMIAPFASVAEAFGWLYVHQRATLLYESVRSELVDRAPEIAGATSALCIHAGKVGEMWDALGPALDRVARTTAVEDRVIQAAHDAFRTLIAWHHRTSAPARASARA